LLLPQAPPVVVSDKVVLPLLHIATEPVGVIATGLELTVTVADEKHDPTV